MYDSRNTCAFEAALVGANTGPPVERTRRYTPSVGNRVLRSRPPTRDELVRRGQFGWDCVEETAAECGIELNAGTQKPTAADKRRASGLKLLNEEGTLKLFGYDLRAEHPG
jgi:hypothetical protein